MSKALRWACVLLLGLQTEAALGCWADPGSVNPDPNTPGVSTGVSGQAPRQNGGENGGGGIGQRPPGQKNDNGERGANERARPGQENRSSPRQPKTRKPFNPGANGTLPWEALAPKEALQRGKPVLLYVYDDRLTSTNNTAKFFEETLFVHRRAESALQGYIRVIASRSTCDWPAYFTSKAQGGAAVSVMTSRGDVKGIWYKDRRPAMDDFVTAARRAASASATAGEAETPPSVAEDTHDSAPSENED